MIGTRNGSYRMVSKRFLATGSGELRYVRLQLPQGPGYSAGTGGTIRISLFPDDGSSAHLPNLRARMTSTLFKPMLPANQTPHPSKPTFREIRFPPGGTPLQAGKRYHLLLENIDPHPEQNYISTDNFITVAANGRPGRWSSPLDWAVLMATRPTPGSPRNHWINLTEQGSGGKLFSPTLEIGLSSGHVQGNADIESGSLAPQRVYTATAGQPIRERFTPSSDRQITGISIATAARNSGLLSWRIMHAGTLVASGRFEQRQPNYQVLGLQGGTSTYARMHWYDIPLPTPLSLRAGQHYDVEFHPLGNSQWVFAAHQNGSKFGFRWPAAFTESVAQHQKGGEWINTSYWNYNTGSSGGFNWPIVLHLAPTP